MFVDSKGNRAVTFLKNEGFDLDYDLFVDYNTWLYTF
jgi:hypothetical protein